MLSQINVRRDPSLMGKIVKAIGRKSKMVDMTQLEITETALQELRESAWDKLKDALKKLLPPREKVGSLSELLHEVEKYGGWQGYLDHIQSVQPSKKNAKPGSKHDVAIKSIKQYVRDIDVKEREVLKLHESGNNDTLDTTQAHAINMIRDNQSVLILGPPGSGKTHCALYSLDVFALRKSDDLVVYVAPTSELVLQAYANLCETFSTLSIGIVCPLLNSVDAKANIVVGTPQELWIYLSQSELVWSKVIADEVHTITDNTLGYADSLKYLLYGLRMSRSERKSLIALSATIHSDDVPKLVSFLSDISGIRDIHRVVLEPSPIPIRYIYASGKGSLTQTYQGSVDPSPDVLFRIFKKLGSDGTLLFAKDDLATWKLFTETLKWLEDMNHVYYGGLIDIADEVNALTQQARDCEGEISRLEQVGTSSSRAQKELRNQEVSELRYTAQAQSRVVDLLHKEWDSFSKSESLPEFYEKASVQDCQIARVYDIQDMEEGEPIPLVVKTLLSEILCFCVSNNTVPHISKTGSFFCLTPRRIEEKEFEKFCQMQVSIDQKGKEVVRIQGDSESEWSAINGLVRLAQAEEVSIASVKPMIKIMVKAFRFGLALMMPSLPFVVTQTIRKLLNDRRIPVIFSTQDLAVGISYPLRNVVIVGEKDDTEISPSLRMQMAGRAGRRGFDTDGRVVFLNCLMSTDIDRLVLTPPTHEAGDSDATCCSLSKATDTIKALSTASGLFGESLRILSRGLQGHRVTQESESLVLRLAETSSIQSLNTAEHDISCQTLQDIRCMLSACIHIHWFAHVEKKSPEFAEHIKMLWRSLKRANSQIIRFCF